MSSPARIKAPFRQTLRPSSIPPNRFAARAAAASLLPCASRMCSFSCSQCSPHSYPLAWHLDALVEPDWLTVSIRDPQPSASMPLFHRCSRRHYQSSRQRSHPSVDRSITFVPATRYYALQTAASPPEVRWSIHSSQLPPLLPQLRSSAAATRRRAVAVSL